MSGTAPLGKSARVEALTGIRGIAAWLVVLYHMRLSLTDIAPAWLIGALGHGYLAVDLFFMLSGFVLWLNYAPKLRAGGFASVPAFLWRRFARIWPLHILMLAAMLCFALVLLATGRDTSAYPFAELPLQVLLIQNWGLTQTIAWNHPAWSISAEWGAYLLFPLLVLACDWQRLPSAVLVACVGAFAGLLFAVFAGAGESNLGGQITTLGLWRCLFEFSMGALTCILWQRWQGRALVAGGLLLAGLLLLVGGVLAGIAQTAFLPLGFLCLLLALALDSGPVAQMLSQRSLVWLGEVSYATYLAHIPLLIGFKLAFVGEDLQIGWAVLVAYMLVLLALSGALYHFWEKPAQSWLNRRGPQAKPVPAAA